MIILSQTLSREEGPNEFTNKRAESNHVTTKTGAAAEQQLRVLLGGIHNKTNQVRTTNHRDLQENNMVVWHCTARK